MHRALCTPRSLAALCTVLVLVAGVVGWRIALWRTDGIPAIFTPEHVAFLSMHDSRAQQFGHRVIVLSIVLLGVLLLSLRCRPDRWRPGDPGPISHTGRWARQFSGLACLAAVGLVLASYLPSLPSSNQPILQAGTFSIAFVPSARAYLLLALVMGVLTVAATRVRGRLRGRRLDRVILVVLMLYGAVLMAPALVEAPNLVSFSPELIIGVEWHLSGVLGPADRLAAGRRLFEEVQVYAGLLPITALAIFQRFFGLLDIGGHIRLVQTFQVLFAVSMVMAYRSWKPRNIFFLLVSFLLVVPWLQTYHAAVLYPNQSAWRSIGFPLGLLTLLAVRRPPTMRVTLGLGAAAGGLVLVNPEIGICLLAGYLFFLGTRLGPWSLRRAVETAMLFAAGAGGSAALFVLIFRAGLGYWPVPPSFESLVPLMMRFAAGYGGLPLRTLEPLPVLIFVHATYTVILSGVRRAPGPLSFEQAFRGAVGATIVLWFAYYAKAPHVWNLWTFLFPYAFLASTYLDTRLLPVYWHRRQSLGWSWKPIVVCLIVLPQMVLVNLVALQAVARGLGRTAGMSGERGAMVGGVLMPSSFAERLEEKVAYVRSASTASGDLVYITANSYFVPLLSGFYPKLPFQDVFAETITNEDFTRLVTWIRRAAPATLLFDADGPMAGYPLQRTFYARLRTSLADGYIRMETVSGWDVRIRMPAARTEDW